MTRQNYYSRRQARQRQRVDTGLIASLVVQERQQQPRIGTRKLHTLYQATLMEAGVKVGRDRLFEVLGELELLVPPKRAESPRTTHSYHGLPVFTNPDQGSGGQEAERGLGGGFDLYPHGDGFSLSGFADR
jgi:hypothetical protein